MTLPNLTAPLKSVASALRQVGVGGRTRRRAWVGNGRAHIEVRAIHRPGTESLARRIEDGLKRLEGVDWAEVNSVLGRVVVAFDGDSVSVEDLIDVVEGVEEAHRIHQEKFPRDRPEHPGDIEPLRRNVLALGADLVGLGVSGFTRFLRATPLPTEIASLISVLESQPRLLRMVEEHVGHPATELGLALGNAVGQALAGGPLALMVDGAHRFGLVDETRARRDVWARREPELCDRDGERVPPLRREHRPAPLPAGPIETYADRASLASLGAFGTALAVTRDPRRAADALLAGVPKAARLGREAFASRLARLLADRGVVVMDGEVLRRLDRIDMLILDSDVALGGPDRHRVSPGEPPPLDPLARRLATAAESAGLELAVAGTRNRVATRLSASRTVAGGARLASSIRSLQANDHNHGIALISTAHHSALRAADCGIGIISAGHRPPWGADLLCGPGLESACVVVEAIAVARAVSRRSAMFALAGSGVGGVWATVGPRRGAATRAMLPVNAAALIAQVAGTWAGVSLDRRPRPLPVDRPPWHELDTPDVISSLASSPTGLSNEEADRRHPPRQNPSRGTALVRAVASELVNPLTPVLLVGTALSAAVGSAVDAALLGGVTAANAAVGGVERVRTERSLERLLRLSPTTAHAWRDGMSVELPATELVPGDVIEVRPSELVPADCRILETTACEVDESSLTGESLPVRKDAGTTPGAVVAERASMLYEGTILVTGTATAVVVATGDATEAGQGLVGAQEPPPSGVEARLKRLTAVTLPVTLAGGASVTALGLLRGRATREAIASGVSLMVAAVPEGLPLLAGLAQQAAAHRLSRRGALVRNPRTIEALGRVDTLCFDKTGTLTQGRIGVQRVSDGAIEEPIEELGPVCRGVLAAALRATPDDDGNGLPHATDRAVASAGRTTGVSAADDVGGWRRVSHLAFEPARGLHAVLGLTAEGRMRLAVKGAPELLVRRCREWRNVEGLRAIDARARKSLDEEVDRLARLGLRVLAVAEKDVAPTDGIDDADVRDLVLVGFIALADLVRPTAAAAVDSVRRAGVSVVMVTGDHPATAETIARDLGILNGGRILTGSQLDHLSDGALDAAMEQVTVFARITPAQKVRIVEAYRRTGRVVAMTGDGANDAPAIRLADAGVALGRGGTPAAREAADLVVVDDRIETIVDAIVEGRAMWMSVRDALAILVGGNLGEIAFTIAATALTGSSPLRPRQLLLVNLLTDLLPAMAIALRSPPGVDPESLLCEGPDASLGVALNRDIVLRAVTTSTGAFAAWLVARSTGRRARARTVGLVALVGTQLGQTAMLGRHSPVVIGASLASAAALTTIVQTPGVSQFFGCVPLGPIGWTTAVACAGVSTGTTIVVPWVAGRIRRL